VGLSETSGEFASETLVNKALSGSGKWPAAVDLIPFLHTNADRLIVLSPFWCALQGYHRSATDGQRALWKAPAETFLKG